MDLDPGILCFAHCSNRIFCTRVPENCPKCDGRLGNDLFPFRVPYPFIRGTQLSCAVLIKSTVGTFLNDFNEGDDLHIGVTSSKRVLYEYDERGLTVSSRPTTWDQSLMVYCEAHPENFPVWDDNLRSVVENLTWTPTKYCENSFNCYDFVLTFLRTLNGPVGESACNRTLFIDHFVTPQITKAVKYIKLYREISASGFHLAEV